MSPNLHKFRGLLYFTTVRLAGGRSLPHVRAINSAVQSADIKSLKREFDRALALLQPRNVHVGLTYDALRRDVTDARIRDLVGLGWPSPSRVAV
jgi:hypothetical protein